MTRILIPIIVALLVSGPTRCFRSGVVRGAFGVCSSGYRTKILMMLRFAKEVRNGKIKRRRPAVVRGVEYDILNY